MSTPLIYLDHRLPVGAANASAALLSRLQTLQTGSESVLKHFASLPVSRSRSMHDDCPADAAAAYRVAKSQGRASDPALAAALEDEAMLIALRPVGREQTLDWHCWLADKRAWLTLGFANGRLRYRASAANLQHELLLRAVRGARASANRVVTVFDATAGLARDAWLLASAGLQVTAVERQPLLAQLLADSLAMQPAADLAGSLAIVEGDSLVMLREAQLPPADVVYLDPMYDGGLKSSAAVKNEMLFLRRLQQWQFPGQPVGEASDGDTAAELLEAALAFAKHKVVVKRAPKAAFLAGRKPASSLTAKALRLDIYPV